jgi:hypothetical protein
MTIDSIGQVGVGTSLPTAKVQVDGGIGSTSGQVVASTVLPAITMYYDTGNDYGVTSSLHNGTAWKPYLIRSAGMIFQTSSDVEAMRIDSSGNVGIGTLSPATFTNGLAVAGSGNDGDVAVINDTVGAWSFKKVRSDNSNAMGIYDPTGFGVMALYTAGAERMRIDNSGNVGIGTSSLSIATKLEVYGNSAAAHVGIRANNAAADGYATLWLSNAGDNTGIIRGGPSAAVFANQLAMLTNTAMPITFNPNNTERMRIESGGNVGIGTTDTLLFNGVGGSAKLVVTGSDSTTTVANNSGAALVIANTDDTANNLAGLHFAWQDTDNSPNYAAASIVSILGTKVAGQYPAGQLVFLTSSATNTAPSEKMRIDSSGNVGIGATPSGGKLYVVQGADGQSAGFRITHGSGDARMYINANIPTLDAVSGGGWNFSIAGTARMTISATGTIDMVPTSAGAGQGLQISSDGMANGSNAVFISMPTNTGNFISGNTSAGQKFAISSAGALSKTSGSFKIDHPLPSLNATHSLVHSFIEGPQADLIYRGTADLVSGVATVNIDTAAGMTDGTFVMLCTDVQCFTSNEDGWTALKGSVTGNILTITAQDNTCTDTVGWMVIGERCDPDIIAPDWTDDAGKVIVEPLKPELIEG